MSHVQVLILPLDPGEPPLSWVFDDAAVPGREQPVATVVGVPGVDVTATWLDLPAGSSAQRRTAARLMVGQGGVLEKETLVTTLGPQREDGLTLVLIYSSEAQVRWRERLEVLGVTADLLTPDYLLLPEPTDDAVSLAELPDRLVIRGRDLAAAVEPDTAELLLAGRERHRLDEPGQLAMAIRQALSQLIDLSPPARPEALGWRDLRLAAALLIALMLSPMVLALAGAWRDEAAARRAEDQARAAAERVLGEEAVGDDPAGALRAARLDLERSGGFSRLAAGLFSAIETVEGAALEGLIYGQDGTLRATIAYRDYEDVQALVAAAQGQNLVLEELNALDERGVRIGDFTARPM
ncbi:type II secretion system protein GspL [Brevundimonas sp. 2R-24]|uniref:Type II secretion system protein GspL n=1 Tax=Peiella sedimenti TaxID=3061083 RepID=A0ABT8SL75_9CAUL|nr:type II secretion system protein GspL [Caulobacteraceae bacterium XZ-24]